MQIQQLPNKEINFIKWDNCVKSSINAIVYAESWYLDIVCPNWIGLIAGDYEIVMPLCKKQKFLIKYISQPYFTQQLGLFTPHLITKELLSHFLKSIPYSYIEMNLNAYNQIEDSSFEKTERINYELDLPPKYKILASNFSENTKRNIQKAIKNKVSILSGTSISAFIEFFKQEVAPKIPKLNETHLLQLKQIISQAIRNGKGIIYSAYSDHNNLLSSAFFLQSQGRVILLANVSNQEGKKIGAAHRIIDRFIEENAQKAIILDFEGSILPGIARFYKGFGATPVKYYQIKKNKLHPIIKIIKK